MFYGTCYSSHTCLCYILTKTSHLQNCFHFWGQFHLAMTPSKHLILLIYQYPISLFIMEFGTWLNFCGSPHVWPRNLELLDLLNTNNPCHLFLDPIPDTVTPYNCSNLNLGMKMSNHSLLPSFFLIVLLSVYIHWYHSYTLTLGLTFISSLITSFLASFPSWTFI